MQSDRTVARSSHRIYKVRLLFTYILFLTSSVVVVASSILKSVYYHPEEHAQRKTSIIHPPIDWTKYPPSSFRPSSTIREENDDEGDEEEGNRPELRNDRITGDGRQIERTQEAEFKTHEQLENRCTRTRSVEITRNSKVNRRYSVQELSRPRDVDSRKSFAQSPSSPSECQEENVHPDVGVGGSRIYSNSLRVNNCVSFDRHPSPRFPRRNSTR